MRERDCLMTLPLARARAPAIATSVLVAEELLIEAGESRVRQQNMLGSLRSHWAEPASLPQHSTCHRRFEFSADSATRSEGANRPDRVVRHSGRPALRTGTADAGIC